MIKTLKKALLIGGLILAEGTYTGGNYNILDNEKEKFEIANKAYESYKSSKLEEISKEESKPKEFFLTPDSLNVCIKQAYNEVKRWPKEFDKRLYRLLIGQESKYNVYAVSWAGAKGLSQIMPDTYKGYRDSTNLETEIFNPVNNIGVSLQVLSDISIFCKKYHPNWENLNLEDKRKVMLTCYNAGPGKVRDKAKWDLKSRKLNKEQRDYAPMIMGNYHNPKIKVKL